ncbi:MAG: 30S ribosomal protein S6 [Bacteroidia bacterium]|nr:30S ribosomal protein S6 [Bacteroidia bacterium]
MDIQPKKFKQEYETTFILLPDLPEGEHQQAVDKFVKMIQESTGTVHNIEHWGIRKLAYPIQRKTTGYYAFVEFQADPEFIAKLDQSYRYDDQVIRYLTVKLEKHAFEFNKKRRELGFGTRKEARVQNVK